MKLITSKLLLLVFCSIFFFIKPSKNNAINNPKKNVQTISYKEKVSFIKSSYGIYTQELLGDRRKAQDIAALKVKYVIYYFFGMLDSKRIEMARKDFQNLSEYGIKIILMPTANNINIDDVKAVCKAFKDVPNLIGWYCFDEPSFHPNITVDKQDDVITAMKSIKYLPCFIAENGSFWPANKLSANYDAIFLSSYAQTANKNKPVLTDLDLLSTYGEIVQFSSIYTKDKLIPIYETFNYINGDKTMSANDIYLSCLNKKKFYGKNGGAFFIYSAAISSKSDYYTGETDRKIYNLINKIITYNPGNKGFKSFGYLYVPEQSYSSTYSRERRLNAMKTMSYQRSTSKIDTYYNIESGIFVDHNKFMVIDFGINVKSVRLDCYVSARSGYKRPLKFTLNKPISISNLNKVTLLKTVNVETNSQNGNARFTSYLLNINSRYLILKGSSENKQDIPYFQAIGYVAIPK